MFFRALVMRHPVLCWKKCAFSCRVIGELQGKIVLCREKFSREKISRTRTTQNGRIFQFKIMKCWNQQRILEKLWSLHELPQCILAHILLQFTQLRQKIERYEMQLKQRKARVNIPFGTQGAIYLAYTIDKMQYTWQDSLNASATFLFCIWTYKHVQELRSQLGKQSQTQIQAKNKIVVCAVHG